MKPGGNRFTELQVLIERRLPGAVLKKVTPLGVDDTGDDSDTSSKESGYGVPLRLEVITAHGEHRSFVFHTATANVFGHQWRADRARDMLLAYDTFASVPNHVTAVDVGAVREPYQLVSLSGTSEFYVLTEWGRGRPYAAELRQIVERGAVDQEDRKHCRILATWLARLHRHRLDDPSLYTRSVRDLVGSGEGIFGIIDGFPHLDASPYRNRLERIERLCHGWRWRLRDTERLRRIHGDFHPFNVLFDNFSELTLLDASRGSAGDPADDVSAMAINYVFFAMGHEGAWAGGMRDLWLQFWEQYVAESGDPDVLAVAPPYLAWRSLVLANPAWYPHLGDSSRNALFDFVEAALTSASFAPELADNVFR